MRSDPPGTSRRGSPGETDYRVGVSMIVRTYDIPYKFRGPDFEDRETEIASRFERNHDRREEKHFRLTLGEKIRDIRPEVRG